MATAVTKVKAKAWLVLDYHERQLAIGIYYRNFCWVPRPTRPRDGSSNWIKRIPAAIAAGLADRVWTPEDMVIASDEFIARRDAPDAPATIAAPIGSPLYWVAHQPYHRTARVHAADCSSCNHGQGKSAASSGRSFWTGFASLDEATSFAADKEPDDYRICKLCLGEYNTLSRYGRRR